VQPSRIGKIVDGLYMSESKILSDSDLLQKPLSNFVQSEDNMLKSSDDQSKFMSEQEEECFSHHDPLLSLYQSKYQVELDSVYKNFIELN
jgi:hypothetical protein